MGRKTKSKYSKLKSEMINILKNKLKLNEKKRFATEMEKKENIYSIQTYENYKSYCNDFLEFLREEDLHKQISSIKDAQVYVKDYCNYLKDVKGNRESTIGTKISGICKLYGIDKSSIDYDFKYVKPESISRGRNGLEIRFLSHDKHKDLISFCEKTGLRRNELEHLRKDSLFEKNDKLYLNIKGSTAKGGRHRIQEVRAYTSEDKRFIQNYLNDRCNENKGIFGRVDDHFNVHWFRHVYAEDMYKDIARNIKEIPKDEIYWTRKREVNQGYDKKALEIITQNLGHNRLNVVVNNYFFSSNFRY